MFENYWLIAFTCFVIFTVGNISLYSLKFIDRYPWIGMILIALIPVVNTVVAVLVIFVFLKIFANDINNAFKR